MTDEEHAQAAYREKLLSLSVARPAGREPKVTTDDHGTHHVDVTEHWDGRVDVTVHAPTVGASSGVGG